ncbi:hypothetical protein [Streptomyces sp. NPDC059460]|uniref:hypothetical protein n=1 Tax=Streptomyces sp. NPDC059460 TaxID=3346840 RepID=UPI0036B411D7
MPGDCSLNQNEVSIPAPETSFYIHHPKFQDVDSAALMENTGPVRVLFPMAVVDELDRLKESKDRHTRWRADHTLAVLDKLLDGDDADVPDEVEARATTTGSTRRQTASSASSSTPSSTCCCCSAAPNA